MLGLALGGLSPLQHPLRSHVRRPLLDVRYRVSTPHAVAEPPDQERRTPGLSPPTEDGGVLSDLLPISLLARSQSADRSADPLVGEDAGVFDWNAERWGGVAVLPASVTEQSDLMPYMSTKFRLPKSVRLIRLCLHQLNSVYGKFM